MITLNSTDVKSINEEFRRLHEHITQIQHEIAQGLSREKFLQDQIDALQGEAITLRDQMALDFQTISRLRLDNASLTNQIHNLTDSLNDYIDVLKGRGV